MIKKIYHKFSKSSQALQKMNVLRKRLRSAYQVLTYSKVEVDEYERIFEKQKER